MLLSQSLLKKDDTFKSGINNFNLQNIRVYVLFLSDHITYYTRGITVRYYIKFILYNWLKIYGYNENVLSENKCSECASNSTFFEDENINIRLL